LAHPAGYDAWHLRTVNLTWFAGQGIVAVKFLAYGQSAGGAWSILFTDVAIASADGSVRPLYTGETPFAMNHWGTANVSGQALIL
jgi:hypothetical protein